MTYQDEFARRNARGARTGEGGDPDKPLLFRGGDGGGGDASASLASANGDRPHPNPSPEGEGLRGTVYGEERTRHPELVSGPRTAEPEDGGKTNEVLSRQAIADKRAQDDGDSHTVRGDEHAPANPVRLERSRETGDGRAVSRLRSTRTDRESGDPNTVSGEPVEPRLSSEKHPSDSQTARSATSSGLTDTTETPTPTPRHDGWLPETRVKFLEALARTGNVQASAYYVQLSRQSAYDLRRRDPDFARGWQAALVLARDVAEDALQERAIEGIEEPVYYHGEVVGMRRRYDSRLLLAHLARLDKIAEQIPAHRAAARFEELMEAIRTGADSAPLIAVPTDDELAAAAAQAEAPPPAAEEGDEFYAVRWPDTDGPPDYYRLTPEEAAEMEGEVPGLTATPTGTRSDAVITSLHFDELARAEAAEKATAKAAKDAPWPDWDTGPDPRELN
tara:strand:+ start:3081 stop:4424 length:1344 start_codon:yes stop_codon:yes gene_type:complete